jgi:hypothetical protein
MTPFAVLILIIILSAGLVWLERYFGIYRYVPTVMEILRENNGRVRRDKLFRVVDSRWDHKVRVNRVLHHMERKNLVWCRGSWIRKSTFR